MMQVVQHSQPATRLKLVIPGNGAIIRGFSAVFCCWQICHSAAAVARSTLVSGSLLPNSISVTMGTLFVGPLGNDREGRGKRLAVHRMGYLTYLN